MLGFVALDELERVSLLHLAFLIASQGGIIQTIVISETYRLKEGTQAAAIALADSIGHTNIHLNTPVHNVRYSTDQAELCSEAQCFTGRRVILTGSPAGMSKM